MQAVSTLWYSLTTYIFSPSSDSSGDVSMDEVVTYAKAMKAGAEGGDDASSRADEGSDIPV